MRALRRARTHRDLRSDGRTMGCRGLFARSREPNACGTRCAIGNVLDWICPDMAWDARREETHPAPRALQARSPHYCWASQINPNGCPEKRAENPLDRIVGNGQSD